MPPEADKTLGLRRFSGGFGPLFGRRGQLYGGRGQVFLVPVSEYHATRVTRMIFSLSFSLFTVIPNL